jgi:biotin operon repressor
MRRTFKDKIILLDHLIHTKKTGTHAELAKTLDVGEARVNVYFDMLRNCGAPIFYSKARRTYYYKNEGRTLIRLRRKDSDKKGLVIQIDPIEFHFAITVYLGDQEIWFEQLHPNKG